MKTINGLTLFYSSREPFSNWYTDAPFVLHGVHFPTSEHAMMYAKAALFGDTRQMQEILDPKNRHPSKAKACGRRVQGYDDEIWRERARQCVYFARLAQFTQHPELLETLLATRGTRLVEASKSDTIWGIGLDEDDPRAADPASWRGTNWLGEVLTRLRDDLIHRIGRGERVEEIARQIAVPREKAPGRQP